MIRYCINERDNKVYEILEYVLNSNDSLKIICRDIQNNKVCVIFGDYVRIIEPPKSEVRNIKLYSILETIHEEIEN